MTLAEFVTPGRCIHCGHTIITWSPRKIVLAAQKWTREHGHTPDTRDWEATTPEFPHYSTACKVFGTWNRMLLAAGLADRPLGHGSGIVWSKEQIAEAMLEFLFREGRWPTSTEWYRGGARTEHRPNTGTVIRAFGSWNAAKTYAGWEPTEDTRWQLRDWSCNGCGRTDRRGFTEGCKHCTWRAVSRRTRKRLKSAPVGDSSLSQTTPPPGGGSSPSKQRQEV